MQTTTKLAIGAAVIVVGVAGYKLTSFALGGFHAEPMRGGYLAARDMTAPEALRALDAFQDAGQIAYQRSGAFVDLGTDLDGVQFQYAGKPLPIRHVTPQFAVLLVRLAQLLGRGFGAVAVQHAGIYPGNGPASDVHNRGAAIDVSGVTTIDGRTVTVLDDWSKKTKTRPGYRLERGDPGFAIFKTIYQFAAREGEDDPGGDHKKLPSSIGDRSMIVSPDHPDAGLAASHRDHVHIQIGPTRA